MDTKGLLVVPQFEYPEKYLEAGRMTELNDEIIKLSRIASNTIFNKMLNRNANGKIVRKLVVLMQKRTKRLNQPNDNRKFRRTAQEILESGERTGCCDSSTLFVALARAQGIPTMQVITFNKEEGRESDITGDSIHSGHFFSACYISDIYGKYSWVIIDTDRPVSYIEDVTLKKMNLLDRNIDHRFYAFAYANDYRDVNINGLKIDSISHMCQIQKIAYDQSDKSLLSYHNNDMDR